MGHGQRALGRGAGHTEARQPALIYTAPSTMSETLRILVENTASEVTIVNPLEQSIRVSKLYRDIPLEVQGTLFLADLMELLFREFDLILGIGWLVKHRVSLNCAIKKVVLRTDEDGEVVVFGECCPERGCEAYLAYISVTDSRDSAVKDIRNIMDFLDVFPKELPSLPPNREVEFRIELLPGIAPVSIAPHRVAPKKLTELKA
ncbi:uncharacterized protein [Gossypium hirsutum]|uniref:DNA/RNA polymerases superfamily protein n=1 Tax=Gossypium hirsutum TaxID=3635 RepID=A0A1U8NIR9_GOSHI|nr:uncharacterized protein LOC107947882 [Gossypium hirsutum]